MARLGLALVVLWSPACSDDPVSPATNADVDDNTADSAVDTSDSDVRDQGRQPPTDDVTYSEEREACADRNALRNPYFGDLHVHTSFSFDAYIFGTHNTPTDAYNFARGERLTLPPIDEEGNGTQSIQLRQPLDFAGVTDHSEFLGPLDTCLNQPGTPGYDTARCQAYRGGDMVDFLLWGAQTTNPDPTRLPEICDAEGVDCDELQRTVWGRVVDAAEAAYDRTSACEFTSFVAYEWTAATAGRSMHRNVVFRNAEVPSVPTSYFEEPTAEGLWAALADTCTEAGTGCDAMAIPHNSNLANGGTFMPAYPGAESLDDERAQAALRAVSEPIVEIFQHKGGSECMNGFDGIFGQADELCDVENIRLEQQDCGERLGVLGVANQGCVSKYDFVRNALLVGLQEEARLGVNPYQFGIIASTDTHNGTPGAADEDNYLGHHAANEDVPERRLDSNSQTPIGRVNNPGGLAGVWAVENSRDAIFDAMERRETFGTSGPRIVPRLFAGYGLPDSLCDASDMVEQAYLGGVPMGGVLDPAESDSTPTFVVSALRDPDEGSGQLQQIQIIKGWLNDDGELHYEVISVAGDPDNGASVDEDTCQPVGDGFDSLCGTWTDPNYDAQQSAFYYARVVENPSCRWSWSECLGLTGEARPGFCDSPNHVRTTHEMAWTSPIWVRPQP